MIRVRYYAPSVRLSSQKQMTTTCTSEAVGKQSRAMSAKAFEIGLFDPNAAQGAMLPRVWNLDTLLRSVSWLRLKNAEGRNIYIRPAGEHSLSLTDDARIQVIGGLKSEGFAPAVGGLALNHVSSPDTADDNGVQVASLLDVAGCKMAVVQTRAEGKDYRDIAALLENGISLPKALAAAKAIYGDQFELRTTLRALSTSWTGTCPNSLPQCKTHCEVQRQG